MLSMGAGRKIDSPFLYYSVYTSLLTFLHVTTVPRRPFLAIRDASAHLSRPLLAFGLSNRNSKPLVICKSRPFPYFSHLHGLQPSCPDEGTGDVIAAALDRAERRCRRL